MLRGKARVWAIVVLCCIVMQFVTTSLPSIVETCEQMDAVFEQRIEEERQKAAANAIKKDVSCNENQDSGTIVVEKINDGAEEVVDGTAVSQEAESEDEIGVGAIVMIILVVLVFAFVLFC